jgi:hypothetical protein
MANLGVGSSVVNELRRDPVVADFLVAIASSASGTKFFVPPLPPSLEDHASEFFRTLPAISAITGYATDKDLGDAIGNEFFEILRYILFTNRCHLIHLPRQLAIRECAEATEQFLCVVATPEKELVFQKKKGKNRSAWLWHGSFLNRWHSILHTGLQDLGRTSDATHGGPWFGDGVYQSNESAVSLGYASGTIGHTGQNTNANNYQKSQMPKLMQVLALCENVPGRLLKNVTRSEYTQRDPDGLIVRCLMVAKKQFAWDPYAKPPEHVPSLAECLAYIAER